MNISEQEITTLRKVIAKTLSEKFRVNQISVTKVPDVLLHSAHIWESDVYAFEFIIDSAERYVTFCSIRNGKVLFTRTKEGIVKYLAGLVRPHDFGLVATGDYFNRNDVVGKFIECRINLKARETLDGIFGKYVDEAFEVTGAEYNYALGYQITRRHKASMTFDCEFELLIKKEEDIDFTTYVGEVLNGNMMDLKDSAGKSFDISQVIC